VSFARELDRQWIIVIAARLSSRVGFPPIGERWKDTVVTLPESFALENARDIFTKRELRVKDQQLGLGDAMSALPFAALTNCSGSL
jgi:maltooligosyltrehalose synthase